jgi:hypothetical protein
MTATTQLRIVVPTEARPATTVGDRGPRGQACRVGPDDRARYRLRENKPSRVGTFPLEVWRATRTAGEYRPTRYFAFCLSRLGLVQPWTWEMPSERFTSRLTLVTPRRDFSDGLR